MHWRAEVAANQPRRFATWIPLSVTSAEQSSAGNLRHATGVGVSSSKQVYVGTSLAASSIKPIEFASPDIMRAISSYKRLSRSES